MPPLSSKRLAELRVYGELLQHPGATDGQKRTWLKEYEELEFQCGKEDPWFFLRTVCYTLNEHPGQVAYAPFPDDPFLEHMVRTWEEVAGRVDERGLPKDRLLAIWKSRQMMASWFVIAMALWTIVGRQGSLVLIRSRKEGDAAALIARMAVLLRHLPGRAKELVEPYEAGSLVITLPRFDARVEGIPQGASQVHGRTPTLLIDDELALQEEAEAGFAEAQPALEGGGMYVGLSSARPGFMYRWVNDEMEVRA